MIDLLCNICPIDITSRVQTTIIEESLKTRLKASKEELKKLLQDWKHYPITYNHYYTIAIQRMQYEKNRAEFEQSLKDTITISQMYDIYWNIIQVSKVDPEEVICDFYKKLKLDIDDHSCNNTLDNLYTFYKVGPYRSLQADTYSLIVGFTQNLYR